MGSIRFRLGLCGCFVLSSASIARAEMPEATAQGAIGFGAFGDRTSTTLDVGAELVGRNWQLGLGARVRFVGSEGVRSEEWDEASEAASVIRFAGMQHRAESPGEFSWSVAAGPLRDARLGRGGILNGLTGSLDVDRRRLGLWGMTEGQSTRFEALVDDVIAPEVVGTTIGWAPMPRVHVAGTFATDWSAPTAGETAAVTGLGGSVAWDFAGESAGWVHTLHGEVNTLLGLGAGVHTGLTTTFVEDGLPLLRLTGEVRVGSSSYMPGYFGSLYELTRGRYDLEHSDASESQRDAVKAGGLGGVGGRIEVAGDHPRIGSMHLAYEHRASGRHNVYGRFLLPNYKAFQTGGWIAMDRVQGDMDPGFTGVVAWEGRVRLPASLYFQTELARMYERDPMGGTNPLWIANVAVGGVLGER